MLRLLALLLLAFQFSCSSSLKEKKIAYQPPPTAPSSKSPLEQLLSAKPSVETPMSPPVNPEALDRCTRHLLFADQYLTASDYTLAEEEIREAEKYCSPNDARLNYMKAVVLEAKERYKEAFQYYYKAAKEYLRLGEEDNAFKAYSGMVSINPHAKETEEIKQFFIDEDY